MDARRIRIPSILLPCRGGEYRTTPFWELFAVSAQSIVRGRQMECRSQYAREASMNSKILIGGLVAACSLLAQPPAGPRGRGPMGFGGMGGPGRRGAGMFATVTGAPYSGVEVRTSQQVLAAGGVISRTEKTNVYRDSQGRVRRESTRTGPDGQTHTRVTIADPVAGTITELDAANKTAFTR